MPSTGVSRGAIAGALLKIGPAPFGTGFADHRDARIKALLDPGPRPSETGRLNLPYEWVPILTTVALSAGCHLP